MTKQSMQLTLRTIAESSIKEAPVNDLLTGAFGYCLLTDAWLVIACEKRNLVNIPNVLDELNKISTLEW